MIVALSKPGGVATDRHRGTPSVFMLPSNHHERTFSAIRRALSSDGFKLKVQDVCTVESFLAKRAR
jgi:hypothetical protein